MQLIPPALVPSVQAYLVSQGQPANLIDGYGNLDAAGVLGLLYNEVEISTTLTPTLVFPIAAGGHSQGSVMDGLVHELQPTVTFRGPAGSQTIAPYGQAQAAQSWVPIAAIGAVVVIGIGWLIFGK